MSKYENAPEALSNLHDWCFRMSRVINNAMQGRTNNVGTLTLKSGTAATVMQLAKGQLSQDSAIIFDPLTANAASELAAGTMYITTANRDVTNKKFTVTHANAASGDRSFRFIIVG